MKTPILQTSKRAANVLAAIFMLLQLTMPITALADNNNSNPPGNNGTFQIHEEGTAAGVPSNAPHVCVFNFEVFGLDANQTGNITISAQSPTASITPVVIPISSNQDGDGSSAYVNQVGSSYVLNDGHYKAVLDNKFGEDPGNKAKSKVFWVDCGDIEPTGSVTGYKWNDIDGDTYVDNEPHLGGWTIFIDSNNNQTLDDDEMSTVTDPDGNYTFSNLPLGTYALCEVMQTGWEQTWPGNNGCQEVELTQQEPDKGPHRAYYFGNKQTTTDDCDNLQTVLNTDCPEPVTGSIGGYKWNDIDGDGNVDDEPKLAGWTIFLDENNNQILDNNELSDTTDGNGDYAFSNLPAGEYTVCEVMQTGWEQTFPGTQSGCTSTTIDKPNEEVKRNFGNKQIPQVNFCSTTEVVGSVSNWIASNGRNHGGECFDYSVTPECRVVNGSVTKQVTPQYPQGPFRLVWREGTETTTGYKDFPATFPEDYNNGSVQITYFMVGPEKDWLLGSGLPNFWDGNGKTITVDTNCDDPEPEPENGDVFGHKFNDANGNGQYDEGEEFLSGFTIELYNACVVSIETVLNAARTTEGCVEELIASDVTDENGLFEFSGIEAGSYYVCEVQQDGWVQTLPSDNACWFIEDKDFRQGDCEVDFGNKAKTPGEVLGEKTPTPQVLANTGSSFSYGIIAALSIIGGAAAVATRRQRETNTI